MKKIVVLVILFSFIFSGIVFPAQTSEDILQKQMTMSFSKPILSLVNGSTEVSCSETNTYMMNENCYSLPCLLHTIVFPGGARIRQLTVTPQGLHSQRLLFPPPLAPGPRLLGGDLLREQPHRQPNENPPASWYSYDVGTGRIGRDLCTIVTISIHPFHYDSVTQHLLWADSLSITVDYQEPAAPLHASESQHFLILAPAEFLPALQPLVTYKTSTGLSTTLVSLEQIENSTYFPVLGRDSAEHIKYFIKNSVEHWNTSYVLLVGSANRFPIRDSHVYVERFGHTDVFASDLYYADIYDDQGLFCSWDSNNNSIFGEYNWSAAQNYDTVDLFPDVHLGRLACIDATQVAGCVNKIITYETSQSWAQPWFTNITSIGADSFTDDPGKISEGEYANQIIQDVMGGFIPKNIWDSNGLLSAPQPEGITAINNAFTQGCGFVDFAGHGSPVQWASHPNQIESIWLPKPGGYFNTNVAALSNPDRHPIVVIGGCDTCKFTAASNCFGWSFVANPTGGGIASFGMTTWGYAAAGGKDIIKGLSEKIRINLFSAYQQANQQGRETRLGELWTTSITSYLFPEMQSRDYRTVEAWQCFGDPSLLVSTESRPPTPPDKPAIPTVLQTGKTYSLNCTGMDPDGDELYCLFDFGDGTYSEWLGPFSSNDSLSCTHNWTKRGIYTVKVKLKDINGVQSDWSDTARIICVKHEFFVKILTFLINLLNP